MKLIVRLWTWPNKLSEHTPRSCLRSTIRRAQTAFLFLTSSLCIIFCLSVKTFNTFKIYADHVEGRKVECVPKQPTQAHADTSLDELLHKIQQSSTENRALLKDLLAKALADLWSAYSRIFPKLAGGISSSSAASQRAGATGEILCKNMKKPHDFSWGLWSWWPDSNWWPHPYQGCALPTELHQHFVRQHWYNNTSAA